VRVKGVVPLAELELPAGATVMATPEAGVAESTVSVLVVGVGVGVGLLLLEPQAAMKRAEESGRTARRGSKVSEVSILEFILTYAGFFCK
jgi:hypothetical protein